LEELLDDAFKGALLSSEEHVAYNNERVFPKAFYHTAEEIIFSFNLCIYMHLQSCLAEEINENILKLQSSGLMETWASNFVDKTYLKEKIISGPKAMVIEQLSGAYELLTIGLVLSFTAFVVEIISAKFSFLRTFMKKL
jgi:hypothetical protein